MAEELLIAGRAELPEEEQQRFDASANVRGFNLKQLVLKENPDGASVPTIQSRRRSKNSDSASIGTSSTFSATRQRVAFLVLAGAVLAVLALRVSLVKMKKK